MQNSTFTPNRMYVKTYANHKNMERNINKVRISHPYSVHTFEDGRITPVFHYSNSGEVTNPAAIVQHGWSVVDGTFHTHTTN